MTCCPPAVTIMSSGSHWSPSAAITSAMHARAAASPSVGPYWSASAVDSCATRAATAANVSEGNALVSGSPPASEITSGRAMMAIRSRIAEDLVTRVREANSPE